MPVGEQVQESETPRQGSGGWGAGELLRYGSLVPAAEVRPEQTTWTLLW